MRILLAVLTSVLFFTACEFNQDPLSGSAGNVQENRPPEYNKPLPEKPMDQESVQLDVPDSVRGRVGTPIELKIDGRVMVEGVGYTITLNNLGELPGATFDPNTSLFKWTPPKTFVGSEPSMMGALRLTMATIPTERIPVVTVKRKEVIFVIENAYTRPIIQKIEGEGSFPAGLDHSLTVTFEDLDALVLPEAKLIAEECSNSSMRSVNNLAYVTKYETTDVANVYKANVRLELTRSDLPTGKYCLGFSALSKHGVKSLVAVKEFGISGRPTQTRITLPSSIELIGGQSLQRAFSVYDQTGNGKVTITSISGLDTQLPGSSIVCGDSEFRNQTNCVLDLVTSTVTTAKNFSVSIYTQSASFDGTRTVPNRHDIRIIVKAAN